MQIKNDCSLDIAITPNRKGPYKTIKIKWSKFLDRIAESKQTDETHGQYVKMNSDTKGEIKDVGGFVGGNLNGTRRVKSAVISRCLLTLDVDNGVLDQFEQFCDMYSEAAALYSTHSHSAKSPSYRLIIPLLRPVDPDEFKAISHKIVSILGEQYFCNTSFVSHQVMYWPSHSKDIEPVFKYQDGKFLDPDSVLASIGDWTDIQQWNLNDPFLGKKQEDPLIKKGTVGVFCRTYDIHSAISKFIPDYERSEIDPTRYTYLKGTTANGVVTYDDKFSFSHHSSDPASEITCNAFDLVRLHLFKDLDSGLKEKTVGNKHPSYKAMEDLMDNDSRCKSTRVRERHETAVMEFSDVGIGQDGEIAARPEAVKAKKAARGPFIYKYPDPADLESWAKKLDFDKGMIVQSRKNVVTILENDINLKGNFRRDQLSYIDTVKALPWRAVTAAENYITDHDLASLRIYLEQFYQIDNVNKVQDGLSAVLNKNRFHPIKDYLNALKWDKTERIETLFIDYVGAADTEYIRAVTRKILIAAIARVFQPGIKFDTMVLFIGPQGKGKSWLIGKLGMTWFSDTLGNINTKEAMESLQGVWLIEVGELSQFRKSDVEAVKHFLSKSVDRFRPSYGRTVANYPRQSVFFGTSNDDEPLKDQTGNRRFWPVDVRYAVPLKSVAHDLSQTEVDQIWAEAVELYTYTNEELIISDDLAPAALEAQNEFTEKDDREIFIRNFIEMKLPANWDQLDRWKRIAFINHEDDLQPVGTVERTAVSVHEIWCELFKKDKADMTSNNTKFIHNIMRKMEGWQTGKQKQRIKFYGIVKVYERGNIFSDL